MSTPTYTYQFGSNPSIDYPRFLVADTDVRPDQVVFADQEILMAGQIATIALFIPPGPGGLVSTVTGTPSYRFIAATLLESLAADRARLGNKLKALDIQVDTSQASADLRATAEALRQAERTSGSFAIAEQTNTSFQERERLWKQMLRIYGG